jgi:hypothetical protein
MFIRESKKYEKYLKVLKVCSAVSFCCACGPWLCGVPASRM